MLNVVKNGQQLALDASGNLLVNIASGGAGGTQYVQGVTQASPTGTVAMGKNPSNAVNSLSLDSSGNLNVNVAAGSSGNAAASATGSAVPASADYTGFNSSGNLVGVSTANPLPVAQQGSIAVTGTFWQTTQPVSLTSTTITGTVAVTESGTWTVATNADGSLAGGAAGAKSLAVGGVYDSALPTLTNGQQAALQLDSSGRIIAVIQGTPAVSLASTTITGSVAVTGTFWQTTQPVSLTSTTITGTVAVTESGTWTVATNADGSLAGGAAGAKSLAVGGVYDSALPVLTNGQQAALQLDSSGRLIAVLQGTSAVSLASTTITGSVAVTGTFWQTTQPVSLASTTITGSVAVTGTFWQATQPVSISAVTGTISTADAADGLQGAVSPATAILDGGTDGTYIRAVRTDSQGKQLIADIGGSADILTLLLMETRAMRTALVALVTENGRSSPNDYEPGTYADGIYGSVASA